MLEKENLDLKTEVNDYRGRLSAAEFEFSSEFQNELNKENVFISGVPQT